MYGGGGEAALAECGFAYRKLEGEGEGEVIAGV